MFVGYFDESGYNDQSASFWIAGYVAEAPIWFDFSNQWNQALARAQITCFHMTDFECRQGQFSDWSNEKRLAVIDALVSIINAHNVYGIGAGLVKSDYNEVVLNGALFAEGLLLERQWRRPYYLAFQHGLVNAVAKMDALPLDEKIAVVFDRQKEFSAHACAIYEQLREDPKWGRGHRLGSISFAAKTAAVPLQAADILVYELRKRLDHKLHEPERAIRKSMERLKNRVFCSSYFDRSALNSLMDEIRRTKLHKEA